MSEEGFGFEIRTSTWKKYRFVPDSRFAFIHNFLDSSWDSLLGFFNRKICGHEIRRILHSCESQDLCILISVELSHESYRFVSFSQVCWWIYFLVSKTIFKKTRIRTGILVFSSLFRFELEILFEIYFPHRFESEIRSNPTNLRILRFANLKISLQ